jgi:hypothetical protein
MNTSRATLLSAALVASLASSAAALETELQAGGLSIGADKKEFAALFSTELQNKAMSNGIVTNNDANLHAVGSIRWYGVGLHLAGDIAVGQDKGGSYLVNDDPTFYRSREVKPGEVTKLVAKVDYLLEFGGVYEQENSPFLQIIPQIQIESMPYASVSPLKSDQTWVGLTLWWALPIEGVELGTSQDWNLADPAYRGAVGFREFYQFGNLDLAFWQLANWGDDNYHNYLSGAKGPGFTTSEIGAKITTPTLWREWWLTTKANWSYWINQNDRDNIENGIDQDGKSLGALQGDAGDLQFSVGIEWRSE